MRKWRHLWPRLNKERLLEIALPCNFFNGTVRACCHGDIGAPSSPFAPLDGRTADRERLRSGYNRMRDVSFQMHCAIGGLFWLASDKFKKKTKPRPHVKSSELDGRVLWPRVCTTCCHGIQ